MRLALAALVCLMLAACGSTPKSDLAAAEVSLTTAEHAALAYVNLPSCLPAPAVNPPLCSKPDVRAQIASADSKAYSALQTAKTVIGIATSTAADIQKAMNALTASVAALTSLVGQGATQ